MAQQAHDAALDLLAQAGVDVARLWVFTDNRRARRFYERLDWDASGSERRSGSAPSFPGTASVPVQGEVSPENKFEKFPGVLWMTVQLGLSSRVWEWRGPAPYHVSVPEDGCAAINDAKALVTYGWGMIPVTVTLGDTTWATSLWPKNDAYVVPLKLAVRRAESVQVDDTVTIRLEIRT